jgi:hypothetical protein
MAEDAAPSGKAPPGRLGLGASTIALATAYPVAACGSRPHNNAGPAAAGPHSTHARTRFLDPGQDAKTPGPGRQCFGGTSAEVATGKTARVESWATKARSEASRRRMPYGHHTTRTPEERLT